MICNHQSIKSRLTGNQDDCILCTMPIIFNGKRWVWLYDVDDIKRRKLIRTYQIDQITGAHA